MKKLLFSIAFGAALILASGALTAFAQPAGEPAFAIVIENIPQGRIFIWQDEKQFQIGNVLVPVGSVNDNGFTASMWGKNSSVVATAVNAIHIKVANNPQTGRGVIFSVLPKEFLNFDPTKYRSYFAENASVFTDIPAGTGIFGGGFAPLVGSRVEVAQVLPEEMRGIIEFGVLTQEYGEGNLSAASQPRFLPSDFIPKEGDAFVIRVYAPNEPDYIEFENRFGGLIRMKHLGEEPRVIGQVLKPVAGVGRFEGTVYARVGRIRANHPGVICVSTSPIGEIGGFQILPRGHAMSPEMTLARTLTQWMVVGPVNALSPSVEGEPPLFSGHIFPSYIPLLSEAPELADISAANRLLGRFYVLAKMKGRDRWGPLPHVTGRDDTALIDLEAIRIYFPLTLGATIRGRI